MNRFLPLPLLALTGCPGPEPLDDTGITEKPATCESGNICTYVGTGAAGLPHKEGCRAEEPTYLVVDMTVGPDGWLYYLDWNNHQIIQLVPGGSDSGTGDGCDSMHVITGTTLLGDGPEGPADLASWNHPTNITFDPAGYLVFAAWHNSRIVRIDIDANTADWFVGTGARNYGGDGAAADAAILDLPVGVEYDDAGNLYIADQANQRVRMVNASDGMINTVCGTGEYGYNGDEIACTEAQLYNELSQEAAPAGKIAIHDGKMYIADTNNHRIRMVTMDDWVIHTLAGTGTPGYSGDGGPATAAAINGPRDVDVGPDGTVYFTDTENECVRAVATDGTISTFAGVCTQEGYTGDGGDPTAANLNGPFGVEVDHVTGAVYIADTYNNVIRRVNP